MFLHSQRVFRAEADVRSAPCIKEGERRSVPPCVVSKYLLDHDRLAQLRIDFIDDVLSSTLAGPHALQSVWAGERTAEDVINEIYPELCEAIVIE